VVLSGGEPLLRSDWPQLVGRARERDLPTALATNGTLIDDARARRIAQAGFHRVSISLDGADPATHDEVRGQAGAFDAACQGARRLARHQVPLQINTTVTALNANQLDAVARLAGQLGAEALHLFLLVPVGCGLDIAADHQLPPARVEDVLAWVCDRAGAGAMEIKATCAPHVVRIAAERGAKIRGGGCLAGRSVAFLSSTGDVRPCGYLPLSAGSVRSRPLSRIWSSSPLLDRLRSDGALAGSCGACPHAVGCRGCRARALASTGELFAPDPACLRAAGPSTDAAE
jgi:radical SAM protein with 4Fe4S-binding SPASM domain